MQKCLNILFCFLLLGCQVIPEQEQVLPLPNVEPVSNALLIDFTGFLCVNCPTAAEEAQRLHDAYPDNLVVVAMHPADNHFTETTIPEYDYTCPAANDYYRYFGGTASTPFPTGIVDMQQEWLDYPSWASRVRASIVRRKAGYVDMDLTDIDEANRSFSFSLVVGVNNLNDSINDKIENDKIVNAHVLLWLVADSIVGAQMLSNGESTLDYTHRHMLRASVLDDPWGWAVSCEAGADAIHTRYRDYQVTDSVGGTALPLRRYSLVAVMLDADTKELLDVKQIQIK